MKCQLKIVGPVKLRRLISSCLDNKRITDTDFDLFSVSDVASYTEVGYPSERLAIEDVCLAAERLRKKGYFVSVPKSLKDSPAGVVLSMNGAYVQVKHVFKGLRKYLKDIFDVDCDLYERTGCNIDEYHHRLHSNKKGYVY